MKRRSLLGLLALLLLPTLILGMVWYDTSHMASQDEHLRAKASQDAPLHTTVPPSPTSTTVPPSPTSTTVPPSPTSTMDRAVEFDFALEWMWCCFGVAREQVVVRTNL